MNLLGYIGRYWLLILIVLGVSASYFNNSNKSVTSDIVVSDVDLKQALNITVDTIYLVESAIEKNLDESEVKDDLALWVLVGALEDAYNSAIPKLDENHIGIQPNVDASLLAFRDINLNGELDKKDNEEIIFLIEIDGANSRVIATSRTGAIDEYRISGTGILTGYLVGSMLSRQKIAGVTSSQLAKKKPVSAKAAARARAGSGSYSRGK